MDREADTLKARSRRAAIRLNASRFLQNHGLVCADFEAGGLPADVLTAFQRVGVVLDPTDHLILLANGGPRFWRALKRAAVDSTHPIDDFSRQLAVTLATRYLAERQPDLLYPGNALVPLPKLGELAGWSWPSPLGLALHPRYGPWFAYRALLRIDNPPELDRSDALPALAASPCERCDDKPCVTACPAAAVVAGASFGLARCASHRRLPRSPCADHCFARSACPVGADYRYDADQLAHHMRYSLASVIRWLDSSA